MPATLIKAHTNWNVGGGYYTRARIHGYAFPATQDSREEGAGNFRAFTAAGEGPVPDFTLLTCWAEMGEFAGVWLPEFWIVQVNAAEPERQLGHPAEAWLAGRFEVLAQAAGRRKAVKLRAWWFEWALNNGGQTATMARWLQQELKHQRKFPNPFPTALAAGEDPSTFSPIECWPFEGG